MPNSSGYGPSKAALTNFTESIYFDFKKHNVKVSVVSPGFIKTPLTDKNEFPMPFLRSPEFVANKVVLDHGQKLRAYASAAGDCEITVSALEIY